MRRHRLPREAPRPHIGYIEAKDIGASLDEAEQTEQLKKRYIPDLPNLILTNYLEFRWYRNGTRQDRTAILGHADTPGGIGSTRQAQDDLRSLLSDFLAVSPQGATNAKDLAIRLAHFAHEIRIVIGAALDKRKRSTYYGWDFGPKACYLIVQRFGARDANGAAEPMEEYGVRANMLFLAMLCSIILASAALADSLPEPYLRSEQPTIGPAPVPVMEQMFWVQMHLDPAMKVKVTCPEGVRLLDKTKPGKNRQWMRFYFRSDRGIKEAQIVLQPAGAAEILVPLRALSYREDIEDKSKDLPGFSPDVRKRGRSFHTDELIARAKTNLASHPDLREDLGKPTGYETMTDDELWRSLISWNMPRQLYSNWPCPYCGEKIYETNSFYPWKGEDRFHMKCPLCGRVFPSNDIAKDDYTSGDFPDDGWGWDSTGSGQRRDAYGWAAAALSGSWQGGEPFRDLALRSLLLGDKEAGHRAGLLLARLAYVYPGMDARWQQVRREYLREGKIGMEQQWEAWNLMTPVLESYDAIWEYLGQDQALADFLHTKDPTISTPEDVRRLIDVYLVQEYGLNRMRRWYYGDNGGWEMWMVDTALCANMGGISDRWLREVFTHAYNTHVDEGGYQDSCLVNYLTREGPTNIGNLGYSSGSLRYLTEIADCLERYPDPKWRTDFNLYDEKRLPRVKAMFDVYLDLVISGQAVPQFGDSFSWKDMEWIKKSYADAQNLKSYLRAYQHWPTDRLAWELSKLKNHQVELFEPDLWPQIDAQAKRAGPPKPLPSRAFDGVGEVILESRPVDPEAARRAGLAIRYGYGFGHAHQDNLNVEMWAKGEYVVPELGYTNWVHPLGSTTRTIHHVTGQIDGGEQYAGGVAKGALEVFAAAPEASFAEVSAQPTGFDAKVYRRAVALLDAPGKNSYVLDVFRLKGGATRTYAFHGPADDGFDSNLQFGAKGEPIFTNLMEPQVAYSDGDVTATWKLKGRPMHFRLHLLGEKGRHCTTAHFGKVDSPPIRFLLAEDTGEDAPSQFIALWETYEDQPIIQEIERLPITGGTEPEGFAPVALQVTLAGGQVDTLIYTQDPQSTHRIGDIRFQGSFGYLSEPAGGGIRCAHVANGTTLLKNGEGLQVAAASYSAKIVAVDLANYTITLDRKLPADGTLDGKQMNIVAGGKHRTSYRIQRVLPPGNVVRFDLSSEIYQSKLEAVNPGAGTVACEIAPPVEKHERFGFPPGYYDGALLTDESRTARYRVAKVDNKTIHLGRAPAEGDFAAKDGLGRQMVHIFDFGEGDEVSVQGSAFARRGDDGNWELSTMSDLKLMLRTDAKPNGTSVHVFPLAQLEAGRARLTLDR